MTYVSGQKETLEPIFLNFFLYQKTLKEIKNLLILKNNK